MFRVAAQNVKMGVSTEAVCVKTQKMSRFAGRRVKLLITTYQEVKDWSQSNSRCDDENERASGNTGLPEQHI